MRLNHDRTLERVDMAHNVWRKGEEGHRGILQLHHNDNEAAGGAIRSVERTLAVAGPLNNRVGWISMGDDVIRNILAKQGAHCGDVA
jgi:hypothetical protein